MTPREQVTYVATHDAQTLPTCAEFAWTAALGDHHREQMHQEAIAALQAAPDEHEWTVAEALADDWRVAKLLMGRPEFVASIKPNWRVSDFWFYSPEWQAREAAADADIAAGRLVRYLSTEEFLASLSESTLTHADL